MRSLAFFGEPDCAAEAVKVPVPPARVALYCLMMVGADIEEAFRVLLYVVLQLGIVFEWVLEILV